MFQVEVYIHGKLIREVTCTKAQLPKFLALTNTDQGLIVRYFAVEVARHA